MKSNKYYGLLAAGLISSCGGEIVSDYKSEGQQNSEESYDNGGGSESGGQQSRQESFSNGGGSESDSFTNNAGTNSSTGTSNSVGEIANTEKVLKIQQNPVSLNLKSDQFVECLNLDYQVLQKYNLIAENLRLKLYVRGLVNAVSNVTLNQKVGDSEVLTIKDLGGSDFDQNKEEHFDFGEYTFKSGDDVNLSLGFNAELVDKDSSVQFKCVLEDITKNRNLISEKVYKEVFKDQVEPKSVFESEWIEVDSPQTCTSWHYAVSLNSRVYNSDLSKIRAEIHILDNIDSIMDLYVSKDGEKVLDVLNNQKIDVNQPYFVDIDLNGFETGKYKVISSIKNDCISGYNSRTRQIMVINNQDCDNVYVNATGLESLEDTYSGENENLLMCFNVINGCNTLQFNNLEFILEGDVNYKNYSNLAIRDYPLIISSKHNFSSDKVVKIEMIDNNSVNPFSFNNYCLIADLAYNSKGEKIRMKIPSNGFSFSSFGQELDQSSIKGTENLLGDELEVK